jgi:hypothetical protein
MTYDSKGGALFITKKDLYYLDGLTEWPEKYKNKKVLVKGELFVYRDTSKIDMSSKQIPQYSDSIKNIIKSPKFRRSPLFIFPKKYRL